MGKEFWGVAIGEKVKEGTGGGLFFWGWSLGGEGIRRDVAKGKKRRGSQGTYRTGGGLLVNWGV